MHRACFDTSNDGSLTFTLTLAIRLRIILLALRHRLDSADDAWCALQRTISISETERNLRFKPAWRDRVLQLRYDVKVINGRAGHEIDEPDLRELDERASQR